MFGSSLPDIYLRGFMSYLRYLCLCARIVFKGFRVSEAIIHMVQVYMGTNSTVVVYISFREYLLGNQKWTIQMNLQHRVRKTKTNKTKTQHNLVYVICVCLVCLYL
jgi:hypothetical protein